MTSPKKTWRGAFKSRDKCPWPGPRPLREDDAALLIGRTEDRRAFQRIMRDNRLVLFHGASGVGKSSILQAGLIPDLELAGYTVYSTDEWGGVQVGDLRGFIAERLGLPGDASEGFERTDRESVVLILDQFEELIRYSPAQATAVFDLVIDLNRTMATKIVISFRSEYLHYFSDLEANVVNFSTAPFHLREVAPEAAEQIVLAGNRGDSTALDPDSAARIADDVATSWRDASEAAAADAVDDDPFSRVGLLHLQAFLYALHFADDRQPGAGEDRQPITQDAVDKAIKPREQATKDHKPDPSRPFLEALEHAVTVKLRHCREAADDVGKHLAPDVDKNPDAAADAIDPFLRDGTEWAVQRTVRHLSSAGYKLIRQAEELSELALGTDRDALVRGIALADGHPSDRQLESLFNTIADKASLGRRIREHGEDHDGDNEPGSDGRSDGGPIEFLSETRRSLATAADAASAETTGTPWCDRIERSDASSDADPPPGVTAGPMMDLAPADVLIEEYRRFVLGLVWLEQSSLIRITTVQGSGAMVSLIHDGFGSALRRWAKEYEAASKGPLSAIAAPSGADFGWRGPPAELGEEPRSADVGGEPGHTVLANLVWRGGRIRADLERVVFVNCDFRGLLLDGCRLTGVNFVNCLLDGAIFSDCVLTGELNIDEPDVWSENEPEFVIEAPADVVAGHAALRGMEHAENAFLSPLPGGPAMPYLPSRHGNGRDQLRRAGSETVERGRLAAPLANGGVAIHGGRISSLVIRRCQVADDSAWRLRHTVGSGLDIVELEDQPAEFRIDGSALRNISISSVVGSAGRIALDCRGSLLSGLWISPDLSGEVTVRNSTIVHAWNASPADGDERGVNVVVLDDSEYHGLIDASPAPGTTPLGPGSQSLAFADLDKPELLGRLRQMDYRRDPADTARLLRGEE